MKTRWYGLLITAALLVANSATDARADHIATFSDLFNGDSLIDGATTYSNFQLISDIGTVSPNFDDISVEGIGNGLEFSSANEFFLFPGEESLILQFSFDVVTGPGPGFTTGASNFAADVPFIFGNGVADLATDFESSEGNLLASTNAIIDPAFGIEQLFDEQPFGVLASDLTVQANLSLFSDNESLVALRSFQINTTAVPEPCATLFAGLLIGGAMCRRRR